MIARVTLEIALRKEFDYAIPPELAARLEVGSRVKVPFGPRQVLGVVTGLVEESTHTNLRPVLKIIGQQSQVTPRVLQLARWMADYYCCPVEIALKSVLPDAVRKEDSGWRERLYARVIPRTGEMPKLTKRQEDVWNVIAEWRELPLTELLRLTGTTAETVRKLEDKGLITLSPQISERDPYAHEHILPTQPLLVNPEQARALESIIQTMDQRAAGILPPERAVGVPPADSAAPTTPTDSSRLGLAESSLRRQDAGGPLSPFFNKEALTEKYSDWLPHWRQSGKLYFVTLRLNDSVAQSDLKAWSEEKRIWESHHPKPWNAGAWSEYHERFTERMENLLDAGCGACVLAQSQVRAVVEQALRYFDGSRYRLGDFVIMPNHVHVLVQPAEEHALAEILHSWKSFTAKTANRLLGFSGTFWRDEYFDHIVRSSAQLEKFRRYIAENPVKPRLALGTFLVGAGIFKYEPSDPDRQENTGGTPQCAVGVPPAEPVAQKSSTALAPTSAAVPLRRQDAGGTLQRAVGVSPADPATLTTSTDSSRPATAGSSLRRQDAGGTFLLHGVTGSGKTEIYLQAIAHALERGRGAIVLVPEISLTPQTVERFKARFSSGKLQTLVAVLHSHLSTGERHDEWHKIRQGRARIVIGARSAIFAPVEPLGLIIVDEEHEHSYKQEESPRYHARDVAVVRGQMEGAVVVLGSATPSMESYYNVHRGKYRLLEMPSRVDDQKMPIVRVVDLRKENRKAKGPQIFSQELKEAITRRLERREQTILFLNRRGYSTSLQCPQCGYVAECPNCSVSLTFHRAAQKLLCHICGHTAQVPKTCPAPKCGSPTIRYSGLGTERVEDTLTRLFPHARIKRMDSDTLKRKEDYRNILGDFRSGKIDILVGTQMIAKGLHFPNVTLVGIIYADLSLHIPDFRAGERTFQLLTQVAGRAGRGDVEGEVFVQSFTPFHPAIQYARRHDFNGFYDQEIEFRQQLKYPPISRIALLILKGRNEDKVKFSADHLRRELEKQTLAIKDLIIAGPAPAPLARAETFYRYQLMLRTRQMSALSRQLAKLIESLQLPDDVTLAVDIDPVNLS